MWKLMAFLSACLFFLQVHNQAVAEDSAKDFVLKAIDAQGGKDKLARFLICRGRSKGVTLLGEKMCPLEGEAWLQLPGRVKICVRFQQNDEQKAFVRVVNGDKAWLRRGNETEEMKDEMLENSLDGAYSSYVYLLVPLLDERQFTLDLVGDAKVAERVGVCVKVTSKGKKDIRLIFDKETGLLVKSSEVMVGPDYSKHALETLFIDYKDFDGVKMPTKKISFVDGEKYSETETTELHALDEIAPEVFSKP